MIQHRHENFLDTASTSPERQLRDALANVERSWHSVPDPELHFGFAQSKPLRAGGEAQAARHRSHRAFTLTELLVVMGIMVMLVAVGLPSVGALLNSGVLENAVGTVESSVTTGRAFATLDKVVPGGGGYRGGGVVFMPDNTIRFVRHSRYNGDEPVYADVADLMGLPSQISVVGLYLGNSLYMTAPPFGVRFDRNGVLQSRSPGSTADNHEWDMLFYDGNGDGDTSDGGNNDANDRAFVVGVVVYNEQDMLNEVNNVSAFSVGEDFVDPTDKRHQWIMENGIPLLFNRYSGTVVKED